MQRRTLLVGCGTAAATALAGCLGSAEESPEPSGDSTRSVVVSETGEVEAEPDLAVLQTAVEASGEDAGSVRDELSERADELREALLAYGIDEDDVTTRRFRIRERIDRRRMEADGVEPDSREEAEEYLYYEGTHAFTVEIRDVDAAGEVVDVAVDAGADDVGRVEFTLSEARRDELREQALEEAIENAGAEAEFVAGELDATIVEATTVDTGGGGVRSVRADAEMAAAPTPDDDAPPTELHPDEVSVRATVDIRYEMA